MKFAKAKSRLTNQQGLLTPPTLFDRASDLVRSFDGPLTEELLREPGKFGLGQVPKSLTPDSVTTSICGYCSTGCSLQLHLKDGEAINLTPAPDYPVNLGMACPKGWEALAPLDAADRATQPFLRNPESGTLEPIDWSKAAETFCDRIRSIQEDHGKASAAFLSTGQICTEEMALLGALAKFEMGMVHGDGNTRQCMATAVTAYKESFGFDAPPYTYADFEESDVIVLVGSNLCIAHPIMWQRILRNKRSPKIIVIDPRRTETAMQATHHLSLQPKTDLVLLYGIANYLIQHELLDRDFIQSHTDQFDAFAQFASDFPLTQVEEQTGISRGQLEEVAELIGAEERVSFWWTMGVNQGYEATRTAQALINLALMTGNIGRPGTGANSITGQCNAMGSRLFSNTTNLLGGHHFDHPEHRKKVAKTLGIPIEKIPDQPSKAYDQIIDGIEAGEIRALWVVATNGAHSWTRSQRFRKLMDQLDFLVVQDLYPTTETARLADLVLPAAGWGEKDGTLINSERRIGLIRKVRKAPGTALADFSIFRLLAEAWGAGEWIQRWTSPESVFEILQELSQGQPCDISGIAGYKDLANNGGIQWPLPKGKRPAKESRLFENGTFFTKNQRARFIFESPSNNPNATDDTYPFTLLTGRGSSAQWHTQTRTGKSEILKKLHPKSAYIELHPKDAARLGIAPDDKVIVTSKIGSMKATAFLTTTICEGQIFAPMHDAETNQLVPQNVDPYSRQPNYKNSAVSVKKWEGIRTCNQSEK